ncbi:MAG: PAS domain-containing protein, partial [Pseudomonadales bacterium]
MNDLESSDAHFHLLEEIQQLRTELAAGKKTAEKRTAELYLSERRFSLAMRGANDGLWDWDLETDEVYYSPRWKSMLGYGENELDNTLSTWANLVHPDDKNWVLEKVEDYLTGRVDSYEIEMRMQHKKGTEIVVLSRGFKVVHESDNKPVRLVGTHVDITERKKIAAFNVNNSKILEMIAIGNPASEIYDAIALMYEARHLGLRCSMLELHGNKLMHGGAPSLPKEYCAAVHGLENGPSVGSCGTSTYTGRRVLVENIETDPKWEKIKHVALPHGMRCCWSEPIKNSSGNVLGAFGMYYNHPAL